MATLGVDLGTTSTVAALRGGDDTTVLMLTDQSEQLASRVGLVDDRLEVGAAVTELLSVDPSRVAREMKRRLGDTTPMLIGGRPYGAESLMAPLLAHCLAVAELRAGGPPNRLVVTHPANWGEFKLDLLREVGRLAGRETIELVAEPVAAGTAALTAGTLEMGDLAAVFDFGGGTLDVAILAVGSEGPTVIGRPVGLERLGGVDIDHMVMAHIDSVLDGAVSRLDPSDVAAMRALSALHTGATVAKEGLSTSSEVTVVVDIPGARTDLRLTRGELEAMIRPRLVDALGALDRAIAASGHAAGELAGIVLVGGTSLIPAVGEAIAHHTGRPLVQGVDPLRAVAAGACAAVGASAAVVDGAAGPVQRPGAAVPGNGAAGVGRRRAPALGGAALVAGGLAAAAAGSRAWAAVSSPGSGDDNELEPVEEALRKADVEPLAMDVFDDGPDAASPSDADVFSATDLGRVTAHLFPALVPDAGPPDAGPTGALGGPDRTQPMGEEVGSTPGDVPQRPDRRPTTPISETHQAPSAPGAGRPDAQPPSSSPITPVDALRAELAARVERLSVPPGSDPAEVADLQADLQGLLERFHPLPGQDMADATATLRYEFEDRVRDFVVDAKLDALIAAQSVDMAGPSVLNPQVELARDVLDARLAQWEPPIAIDPAVARQVKAELEGLIDRYSPAAGQSDRDAAEALVARYEDRLEDLVHEYGLGIAVGGLAEPAVAPPPAPSDPMDGGVEEPFDRSEWIPAQHGWVNRRTLEVRDDLPPLDPMESEPSVPAFSSSENGQPSGFTDVFDDLAPTDFSSMAPGADVAGSPPVIGGAADALSDMDGGMPIGDPLMGDPLLGAMVDVRLPEVPGSPGFSEAEPVEVVDLIGFELDATMPDELLTNYPAPASPANVVDPAFDDGGDDMVDDDDGGGWPVLR